MGRHKGYKHDSLTKGKMGITKRGVPKSIEHRKKLSEQKKGDKHPNWKGGISSINERVRKCSEYKLWRKSVFERDGYKCIWCGESKMIEADHIKPFALYPELRFAIDNGRTLCHACHKTTDTYAGRIIHLTN